MKSFLIILIVGLIITYVLAVGTKKAQKIGDNIINSYVVKATQ